MIQDENTDVVEVVQEDDTVVEEETTTEATEDDVAVLKAELAHAKAEAAKYRRLQEKAKKPDVTTPATSITDPIEAALRVNGMSKELLEQLKKVSALTGKDLVDAQSDPIFIAVKETIEKDKKREDASLPASRGAGTVKPKVGFNTPGLTREQHMALVNSRK